MSAPDSLSLTIDAIAGDRNSPRHYKSRPATGGSTARPFGVAHFFCAIFNRHFCNRPCVYHYRCCAVVYCLPCERFLLATFSSRPKTLSKTSLLFLFQRHLRSFQQCNKSDKRSKPHQLSSRLLCFFAS